MIKTYPAKVSYTLLGILSLLLFAPLVMDLSESEADSSLIGMTLFILPVYGFVLFTFLRTRYTINGDTLHIQCGFFTYSPIPIRNIREVTRTRSILSSPAPSFDRIEVKYDKFNSLILSPKNKKEFVAELQKCNPNIQTDII